MLSVHSLDSFMQVYFTDLEPGQGCPAFAMYEIDAMGRPVRKLAVSRLDRLFWVSGFGRAEWVGLGPDLEDFSVLPADALARYRVATVRELWKHIGLRLSQTIWRRFTWGDEGLSLSGPGSSSWASRTPPVASAKPPATGRC